MSMKSDADRLQWERDEPPPSPSPLATSMMLGEECDRLRHELSMEGKARAALKAALDATCQERDRLKKILADCCEDHIQAGNEYEQAGNTAGAMQLRAVANLLGLILQGMTPTTVLRSSRSK